jgi:hypothetical protein
LEAQFGAEGSRLHAQLQGTEEGPVEVYSRPPKVECEERFEHPVEEPGPLKEVIFRMVERSVSKLEGRTAQRMTIKLVPRSGETQVSSRTLREAQCTEHALRSTTETLLKQCLSSTPPIVEVEFILGALANPEGQQGKLFFERPEVQKAVEAVHRKHPGTLHRAVLNKEAVFEEDRVTYEQVTPEGTG